MDEFASSVSSNPYSRSARSSFAAWIVACVVATTALSLVAAHAPARVRLIGLFSLAFGLLVGWFVAWLAVKLDAKSSRPVICVAAAIFTLGGLIGCTWETFRLEELRRPRSANEELGLRLIEQMKMQNTGDQNEHFDLSTTTAFRKYLTLRIRQIGNWPRPWAEVFWISELIAGTFASVWFSNRIVNSVNGTSTDLSPGQS
jgi:hypothetical protein